MPCRVSTFSSCGVVSGSGPSSNVRATAFRPVWPRLITGRKKQDLGEKEAAAQSKTKIARGKAAQVALKGNRTADRPTATNPVFCAGETVFISGVSGLILSLLSRQGFHDSTTSLPNLSGPMMYLTVWNEPNVVPKTPGASTL
jgi:hypothetical protein